VNNSLIAVRYSKALFKLVKELGTLDSVYRELVWVGNNLSARSELEMFLNNPIYQTSQKVKIVKQVFEGKCSQSTLQFLLLVVSKGRDSLLPAIVRSFGDLYRSEKGIKRVVYSSAVAPTPAFEVELKTQLERLLKCKVELSVNERKELIGGFELIVDNKMLDVSIASKLKQMKKRLLDA
jgi:F-type H+-transporting ATPase subunit delta